VARQPIAGDRLARLDRQRAAFEVAELGQRDFRPVDLRQDYSRLSQKCRPSLGQFDSTANAVEEFRFIASLQRRDRVTGRRLGEVESLCGLSDVLALRDRHENPKLFQCHGES
jgi:hypothetical protein